MLGSDTEVGLECVHKKLAKLKSDLQIEQILFANMKELLKQREEEIVGLYNIIDNLMGAAK